MYIVPVILMVVLFVVVMTAGSMKKKGAMTEAAYGNLVSVLSVLVTVAALAVLFMRLR